MNTHLSATLVLCSHNHEDDDCNCAEQDYDLEVAGSYTPGTPGRYQCDPGDCYEGEPAEAEIDTVWLLDGKDNRVRELKEREYECVSDTLCEALMVSGAEDHQMEMDTEQY